MITADDAAKVFGGPGSVQPPSGREPGVSAGCVYKQDNTGSTVHLLQVRAYRGSRYYGAEVFRGSQPIKITGAQKAFESVRTGPAGATTIDLQFIKGDTTGAINYVATAGADASASIRALRDVANKLAQKV